MNTTQTTTKVIIIEPKLINQMVCRLALQQMGCQVQIVENGEKALSMEKCCAAADLILVNIDISQFSDCSSMSDIRRLRKKLSTSGVPVVEYFIEKEKTDNTMYVNMYKKPAASKSQSIENLQHTIKQYAA